MKIRHLSSLSKTETIHRDFPGSLKVEKSRIRTYEDSRPRIYNQLQLTTLAPSQFLPLELVFFAPFNTCDSSVFLMLYSVFTIFCALSTFVYQDSQDNQNNEDR